MSVRLSSYSTSDAAKGIPPKKLVLWHRDAFLAVKTDIRSCCQFVSGAQPASFPVLIGLSFYERRRLESEADQVFQCTAAPWLGMEECDFI
jgi:hypothetical protein